MLVDNENLSIYVSYHTQLISFHCFFQLVDDNHRLNEIPPPLAWLPQEKLLLLLLFHTKYVF